MDIMDHLEQAEMWRYIHEPRTVMARSLARWKLTALVLGALLVVLAIAGAWQ